MQIAIRGCLLLLGGDGQKIGLEGDIEIVLREARHGNRDPVAVVTGLDDVIGGQSLIERARWAFSRRLKTRSKPTLERKSGA
jgi:hypothetical protein